MVNKRNDQNVKISCNSCCKNINKNNHAIFCSNCNQWSHKKCNLIDKKHYKLHQLNPNIQFFCTKCKEDNIPFMKLNEFEFLTFINDNEEAVNDLKPNHTQKLFFERINKEINDYNDNYRNSNNDFETDEQMRCRYYDATDFNNSKFDKTNNFSLLHLNIHSIQAHFEDLLILLNSLNIKFDVIALSESKLNNEPTTNINIPGYHPPIFTFTESTKGGTMLYVEENINFKPRKDLEIYDPKNLESTFIEIINPNESNSIVAVIYAWIVLISPMKNLVDYLIN